jgi:uncharacterized protein
MTEGPTMDATTAGPDYAQAVAHALHRLRSELPATLRYHNVWHTEGDVLPAVRRLARRSRVAGPDLQLLELAAAYHDLGYIHIYRGHEALSIAIMAAALPRFGYGAEDIERVAGMIRATRMPQSPHTELEQLMADADLDVLGRSDFFSTSQALWQEQAAFGKVVPWPEWQQAQLHFLRTHRYFTPAAQALRGEAKQRNITLLEAQIQRGEASA